MVWLDCAASVIKLRLMLPAEFFQWQLSFKIFGSDCFWYEVNSFPVFFLIVHSLSQDFRREGSDLHRSGLLATECN